MMRVVAKAANLGYICTGITCKLDPLFFLLCLRPKRHQVRCPRSRRAYTRDLAILELREDKEELMLVDAAAAVLVRLQVRING